ncbi:Methyltransferase domain-containing protein [Seinonella peptonophila]|uniref:Methyltransferase domain-containing protein n=1 Tax=Seinonella peptonophila TaxID=112248 RepID=A0A1M4ZJK1_9BACL|nr:class I SAM-dependent methyltransferase [Seinonella peptonophila]SHF18171.1 Methyltransferase domain-containing protein [Seinonella peptonophila]
MTFLTDQSIYQWPQYYDWTSEGLDHDTFYYLELAKQTGGPVLELGCGTGRVALAIAREGVEVVGLDVEAKMLEYANAKASALGIEDRVTWIHSDMSDFNLSKTFPLIIIPYRSFQHLDTVQMQMNALQAIRHHLDDEGLFAFNLFVPLHAELQSIDNEYAFRGNFSVPGSDEQVDVYDFSEVDYFNQIIQIYRYYERFTHTGKSLERLRTRMKIRYTYPQELEHLLARQGFRVRARYGDFLRGSFHPNSYELIMEAEKNRQ